LVALADFGPWVALVDLGPLVALADLGALVVNILVTLTGPSARCTTPAEKAREDIKREILIVEKNLLLLTLLGNLIAFACLTFH